MLLGVRTKDHIRELRRVVVSSLLGTFKASRADQWNDLQRSAQQQVRWLLLYRGHPSVSALCRLMLCAHCQVTTVCKAHVRSAVQSWLDKTWDSEYNAMRTAILQSLWSWLLGQRRVEAPAPADPVKVSDTTVHLCCATLLAGVGVWCRCADCVCCS